VEKRTRTGHWEIDTVMGESPGESSDCILTLVERKTGYVMIGKLKARTAAEANRALLTLMARHPGRIRTITADNGTGFHWYARVEAVSPVKFYFATPHHSWERGTNRKHQRPHPPIPAQRPDDGPRHPGPMRPDRRPAKQPPPQKTWIQNPKPMPPSPLIYMLHFKLEPTHHG
jgi:hypothetical protein